MKRIVLAFSLLALGLTAPIMASASTYFGFQIGIGNAPPPPRVAFRRPPPMVFVPDSRVYVVNADFGYDVFRDGNQWYLCNGAYWYRAPRYGGPYTIVDVRYVPRRVLYVPAHYWRHPDWSPGYRHAGHVAWTARAHDDRGGHRHGDRD